ncbi:MAG: hypothetical protein ACRDPV_02155 [Gaiellaceae bacterium]
MLRPVLVALLAVLALSPGAHAHSPFTAIGRAVEAFGEVPVSYDNGAAVSDVEAGGFPQIVGSNTKVAFMPASATSEIVGGPDAIAAEIAREANLDGTLVVLVGTKLGAWSNDIGADRLAELVAAAQADESGTSPASVVESLVRSVQSEPVDSGLPWRWIGAILLATALGGLVAFDRLNRRSA